MGFKVDKKQGMSEKLSSSRVKQKKKRQIQYMQKKKSCNVRKPSLQSPPLSNSHSNMHSRRKKRNRSASQVVAAAEPASKKPKSYLVRSLDFLEFLQAKRNQIQCQSVSTSKFDVMIVPLLDLYYRQTFTYVELISVFASIFTPLDYVPKVETIHDVDMCPTCNIEYQISIDESLLKCGECGEGRPFLDATVSSVAYGDEIEYTSFSYKRINHLTEWLNHFQAKETTPVPIDVITRIMFDLRTCGHISPSTITFGDVKLAQKISGVRRYYDHTMQIWCRITGNPPVRLDPQCEEKIRLMFIRIQAPFEKHCPPDRQNFLSYPYCMYKFCQLLGYLDLLKYFSLLKGKDKLKKQEDVFCAICSDVGWSFVPIDESDVFRTLDM